jgi:uncharacterized protein
MTHLTDERKQEIKQLLLEKREEILKIAAKHGAYNVRIFGSVARGEDDENSDVDFLIDYDLSKISPWFPGGLSIDLEDLLGRKVDIATEKGLHYFIRDKVLREAIQL